MNAIIFSEELLISMVQSEKAQAMYTCDSASVFPCSKLMSSKAVVIPGTVHVYRDRKVVRPVRKEQQMFKVTLPVW